MAKPRANRLQKKAVHYGEVGLFNHLEAQRLKLQSGTGFLQLPSLTTGERDALTAVNGMVVYNETLERVQVYQNGGWFSVASLA
jgi:hypothetical protein